MQEILAYSIRVILIFFFTYFAARVLSKKAIAEMTAYEMAGIIILSTIAAEPLVTKVVSKALLGVGVTVGLIIFSSKLSLIQTLTPIMEHAPTVVIKDGNLDMPSLRSSNLSLNQLMGLLRAKGYSNISDVEVAILEPQGKLSVIPKSQKRPVQPSDLSIPTQYEGLTLPLVMDGAIMERNLAHANLTEEWLIQALAAQGITDYTTQVAMAELDTQGNLVVSRKK